MKYRILLCSFIALITVKNLKAQSYSEILGRPTDSSITMSVMFDQNMDAYWEYGEGKSFVFSFIE